MEIILVLRGGGVCFLRMLYLSDCTEPTGKHYLSQGSNMAQNAKFWLNVNEESWRFIVTFLDLRGHARTNPVRLPVWRSVRGTAAGWSVFLFMESLIHQLVLLVGRSPLAADLTDWSKPLIDRWFIQSAAKCLLRVSNNSSNKPSVDSQEILQ